MQYLLAAESGDMARVQRAVTDQNVNINCLDHLGRSALELALMGGHTTIVEYLLPRSNLQCIEDTLMYAIEKDNVKMCELILEHPLYRCSIFLSLTLKKSCYFSKGSFTVSLCAQQEGPSKSMIL